MARFPIFFVGSLSLALVMIGAAAFSALPKPTSAVEAKATQGSLVLDGDALNSIAPTRQTHVTPAPGPRGDQSGPRLVSEQAFAVPREGAQEGARLQFGPTSAAKLANKTVIVQVFARALPNNPATRMAMGLEQSGQLIWQEAPVKANFEAVRFSVPIGNDPPSALVFWPSTTGNGLGIEIKSITITNQDGTPL